ncbi:MAG: MATE family efflux transporter [Synergistaceae bacterium]|nr:MATE family efflux transporter [Synergistaceae bacterium]
MADTVLASGAGDSERDEKYARMIDAPVERLVCELAIPTISIMLISALYNMADTYFVGSIGTSATGAVGISFSLMAFIQAVGFFFGHGSGNYISRQMGAKNWGRASSMAATGFLSAMITGALMAVFGLSRLVPFARFLGATETILPYACDYLFYILIGAPWMTGSLVLNNLLRFQGSAFYGMIGMISGAVLNLALDPLFIFVFGMGVGGAALATIISQFVSCALLLVGCTRKGNISIDPRNFSPGFSAYKEILRGGLPSLFRQGFASVAFICMNQAAGGYGDAVIAAISIVHRVFLFASSALVGFGQGFQPVCGFNYGARRYDRVKKGFWFCVRTSSFVLLALAGVGYFFAPGIVALFRDDAEVIRVGTLTLRLQCFTFPLMGWVLLNNMMMQTIGKAVRASILALTRQGLFLVAFLWILTPPLGVLGIQLSQPASDLATFLLAIPLSVSVLKEMKPGETSLREVSAYDDSI